MASSALCPASLTAATTRFSSISTSGWSPPIQFNACADLLRQRLGIGPDSTRNQPLCQTFRDDVRYHRPHDTSTSHKRQVYAGIFILKESSF
jgi:hypothetical protein